VKCIQNNQHLEDEEAIMSSRPAGIGLVLFRQVINRKVYLQFVSNITKEPFGGIEVDPYNKVFSDKEMNLWVQLLKISAEEVNSGTIVMRLQEDGYGQLILWPDTPDRPKIEGSFNLNKPMSSGGALMLAAASDTGKRSFDDCVQLKNSVQGEPILIAIIECLYTALNS
jgi:hypothetical protein